VAISTVVPVRLIRSNNRMMPIEVARGLVGKQDERPVNERPSNADALLLTAGQLTWERFLLLGQAHQIKNLGHLLADDALGAADHIECKSHVFVNRLIRQQLEVLKNATDVAAQIGNFAFGEVGNILTGHVDMAVGGQFLS
jgi:hypothetical protein